MDNVSSKCCFLLYGVPPCSVAGHFKFTICTGSLHDIAFCHGHSIHMYPDDTQIYIGFDLSATAAKSRLETFAFDIRMWMCENKLLLSVEKTELVMINPSRQAGKVDIKSVQVEDCHISEIW